MQLNWKVGNTDKYFLNGASLVLFFSLHKCGLVVCVYDTTGIPKHSTKYTLHIKSIYSKLTNFYLAVGLFFKPPKIWENIQFTMLQKLSKCEVKA